MKKRIIILAVALFATVVVKAQNFGVGTQAPIAKTHIVQEANENALRIDDEDGDTTPFIIDEEGVVTTGNNIEVTGKIISTDTIRTAARVMDKTGFVSPVGVIQAYVGTTAPQGWIICDGSEVNRTDYADLFTIAGIAFGDGDGVTTFNLPDMRGMFMRGMDNGIGNDPDAATRIAQNTGGNTGDAVGSMQLDGFQGHRHPNGVWSSDGTLSQNNRQTYPTSTTNKATPNTSWTNYSNSTGNTGNANNTDGTNGTPRISSETRPKNINVNYIIKY